MKSYLPIIACCFAISCVNSDPHGSYEYAVNLIVKEKRKISEHPYKKIMEYLTHKSKDENGNDVYHFLRADWESGPYKGKCKIYYVVDPKTDVIIDWGYDEGGNPKSCVLTG